MSAFWHPVWRWENEDHPHIVLTPGPDRIYDDNPKPEPPRPPIGFRNIEIEPLLWDGDDA